MVDVPRAFVDPSHRNGYMELLEGHHPGVSKQLIAFTEELPVLNIAPEFWHERDDPPVAFRRREQLEPWHDRSRWSDMARIHVSSGQ